MNFCAIYPRGLLTASLKCQFWRLFTLACRLEYVTNKGSCLITKFIVNNIFSSCGKIRIVEMKTGCSGDRQQIQYQQSIKFLRSQHQELVGNLHEEIERLKRKNRELQFCVVMMQRNLRNGSDRQHESTASDRKLDEFKTMFLESEIRDLQKLLNEERNQNQTLSQKLQLTERQLAVERLKPKQDDTESSVTTVRHNHESSETAEEPTSTGLPFSATVDPLLVHVPPRPPRPPTLTECQAIVKHLYAHASQQARQLKQLKLDLHDVLYSHKWTPDAYLLARAYITDEDNGLLNIGHTVMPVSNSPHRIPLRHATKKVPEAAYHIKDVLSLPPVKNIVGNPAVDRQKRTRDLHKLKTQWQ